MLAQNFKTAAELQLTEDQSSALIGILHMLERGELKHIKYDLNLFYAQDPTLKLPDLAFNMGDWCETNECGTVGCIGGWAEKLYGAEFPHQEGYARLPVFKLFYPNWEKAGLNYNYYDITNDQAARALRNFLSTGEPRWDEVLAH